MDNNHSGGARGGDYWVQAAEVGSDVFMTDSDRDDLEDPFADVNVRLDEEITAPGGGAAVGGGGEVPRGGEVTPPAGIPNAESSPRGDDATPDNFDLSVVASPVADRVDPGQGSHDEDDMGLASAIESALDAAIVPAEAAPATDVVGVIEDSPPISSSLSAAPLGKIYQSTGKPWDT